MLDAGLGPLHYLKSRILPMAAEEDSTWDVRLAQLGLGVARLMEAYVGRFLDYGASIDELHNAWTLAIVLRRYPVASIEAMVVETGDGATAEPTPYEADVRSGLVTFVTVPGERHERIRVTYSGGYWLDPMDGTPAPEGATPLPADILEAWVVETQARAEASGMFEAAGLRPNKDSKIVAGLSAAAREILNPHRRFA